MTDHPFSNDPEPDPESSEETPRDQIRAAGVSAADCGVLSTNIAAAANFCINDTDRVEFTRDERDTVEDAVVADIFKQIVDSGTADDIDNNIAECFSRVTDDFHDPKSTAAHSSVALALGKLSTHHDAPEPIHALTAALMADNYDHVRQGGQEADQ